jgi:hypothetical protein
MKEHKKSIIVIAAIIIFLIAFCFMTKTFFNDLKTTNIQLENVVSIKIEQMPGRRQLQLDDAQIEQCVNALKNIKAHNEYFEYDDDEIRYNYTIKFYEGKTLKVKHLGDNRIMINNEVHMADDDTINDLIAFEKSIDFSQIPEKIISGDN